MTAIVLSLAPVFLLIVAGSVMKRAQWLPEAFWPAAEKLTYYVLFPALLVENTAKAALGNIAIGPMAAALILPILAVAGLVLLARPLIGTDGPSFTSVFQGSMRPNTYVGIAGAFAMFGEPGLTLTALAIVCCVPTVNVLGVAALIRFAPPAGGPRPGWRAVVLPVLRNPLIVAPFIGALLNASGVGSPPVIGPFLDILGKAALPVGLMAVGAGLNFAAVRPAGRLVAAASALKLLALPALTFAAGRLFGLDALALSVAVLYAALPVSASSYVLARQMGGNAPLMAGIITATTIAAALTLPAILALLA
jgi:predicted permease